MGLMNKDELRRLEKAVKDKNKAKLYEWAVQFEEQVIDLYRNVYDKRYRDDIQEAIINYEIAVAYTMHFSEETQFGQDQLTSFLEDLMVTLDMYRTGESDPTQYLEELKENGVILPPYDYSRVYRERLEELDSLIAQYRARLKELGVEVYDSKVYEKK